MSRSVIDSQSRWSQISFDYIYLGHIDERIGAVVQFALIDLDLPQPTFARRTTISNKN